MWAKLKETIWQGRGLGAIALGVAIAILGIRGSGGLQAWELEAFDRFVRWQPLEERDERIVIVGIEERDLRRVRHWPISDEILAQLIQKINTHNPTAIGLDLYRDLPVPPGSEALTEIFKATPNLMGIELIDESNPDLAVAPPPVLKEGDRVSFNNVVVDPDGKLRRAIVSMPTGDGLMTSLGATLAGIYLQAREITIQPTPRNPNLWQVGTGTLNRLGSHDGGYVGIDNGGYQILLNYRGPAESFLTFSMTDVLEDKIPPDFLRDRIVLIGATAVSLNDFFYTPYSGNSLTTPERTPGVEIQANIASQLIALALDNRPLLHTLPEGLEGVWIVLWSAIGAMLCWVSREGGGVHRILPLWTGLAFLGVGFVLVVGSYLALWLGNWWLPVVPAAIAFIGSAVGVRSYIAWVERQDRQTIMTLFSRHVTPQIAETIWRDRDQLLKAGRLPGRKATATVLFSDLKGFSTISTTIDPETLILWLNEYMDGMAEQVLHHGGVVDKFIGDAVMAVFGVPIPHTQEEEIAQDAIAAVSCALAMAHTLERLNQTWQEQGKPQTAMRVGIATGEVVSGTLGSAQRIDYTTLGDSVNVAARLESYDKSFFEGICRILINEETYRYVKKIFPAEFIGEVTLKGRRQPTKIYQILRFPLSKPIIRYE